MASQLGQISPATYTAKQTLVLTRATRRSTSNHQMRLRRGRNGVRIRVSNGGESYLDMWQKAVDRERKEAEFQKIADNLADFGDDSVNVDGGGLDGGGDYREVLEKKSEEFKKILDVSKEERDRIQRMQVVDRAAAAIAAARALLEETNTSIAKTENSGVTPAPEGQGGALNASIFVPSSEASGNGTPGPDFWSWTPPQERERNLDDLGDLKIATKSSVYPASTNPVVEKTRSMDILSIPMESKLSETNHNPPLPPFQSLIEVEKENLSETSVEAPSLKQENELGSLFSAHAAEAADALDKVEELSTQGVQPDGSRWWKETGIERRPDGVICRWTMTRGVSADQVVEWQDKFWEAADEFGYKELGSEKSGRDATGNVWREFWRESMRQERGLVHLEKTADKWGKNGYGDEWQEKWWEHYDASGQSEKWAHKWCSIDPNTQLEVGHAHVWHERWGEKYDGHGGSIKYTDKWAERSEGDGWTKWGDKWDENFDPNGNGVKQGETWWEGKHGERWNRTWGEGHNGSGWVHKYGKSSSGEHWDTHEEQETWYERFPHYGFYHCFDNSVQLREVRKPSEFEES
ncbi:hypothetical protein JRO89_XS03G0216700 [Xanthoceras sorbifolium]|uniref:Uncharacterized protein n=1 Tax=Xanthoceras sorbifolium TaxID=99658 RepID=A0ABQ8IBH5_9ROSI|nr:hypothetical protein JRO89_XS03G0216700 [Xanthoceras sorbifolium]